MTGDRSRHILLIGSHRAEDSPAGWGTLRRCGEVKLSSVVIDFDSITS